MVTEAEQMHNATAHAAWWIAHSLLGLVVDKGLLSRQEAIDMLQKGVNSFAATGGSTNRATAMILEQVKTRIMRRQLDFYQISPRIENQVVWLFHILPVG